MAEFMHACDVLVFPTSPRIGEGLGLAMLEAMAAGLPIVATATGPMPEVVDDGATGIIVPPEDPSAMAAALVRLSRDPEMRSRMGAAGAARQREHFSIEQMVRGTLGVYAELGVVPGGPSTTRGRAELRGHVFFTVGMML